MFVMRGLPLLAATAALALPSLASAQASASAHTYATRYDLDRRVVGTIAPDPDGGGGIAFAAVRNTYDAQGRLTKVERGELSAWQSEAVAPASWTGFTVFKQVDTSYDASGRKLVETLSSGGTAYTRTQWSYDGGDKVVCQTVRMNAASNFAAAPSDACTLGTEGSYGPDRITKTLYDVAGRPTVVKKAFGTPLQQDYVSYTYTANGKQATVTDANGGTASYVYDGLDRQSRWHFPSKTQAGVPSGSDYEEYGYDDNGNRTTLRKRDGRTLTFAYDALNRVTSKIVPDGCAPIQAGSCTPSGATRDVYFGYDNRGLQLYARFDNGSGEGIATAYDNMGRPSSSTSTMGSTTRTIYYGWDGNGNRTRVTHPDWNFVNYNRDGLDRLYYADLNSVTVLFHPPYDNRGRVSALYRLVGSYWLIPSIYQYDAIDRLNVLYHGPSNSSAQITSWFGYNPASQIVARARDNDNYVYGGDVTLSRNYTVNGLNQYLTAGPASFTYDANGNLTSDGSTTYVYDAENRLVSASGAKTAALDYDPLGRLNVSNDGSTTYTRYLYDGDELIAEYDASGNMLRRYVHSGGDDDPVVWYEGSGTSSPRYLYADHQGSITAVTDSSGSSIITNTYDDWGVPGSSNAGRFQYTGQAWLPELGMYYYKARIYSPTLGRFLQTDPIGYDDQVNLYAYVGNDPVNGRDPDGMVAMQIGSCAPDARGNVLSGCSGGNAIDGANNNNQSANNARPRSSGIRGGIGNGGRVRAGRLLLDHEGGRQNGHAYRAHVGRTLEQMRARIGREGKAQTSTFNDAPTAEAAYKEAVSANEARITAWLNSGGQGSFTIQFKSPVSIGRVLNAGDRSPRDAYTAIFHIRANEDPFIRSDISVITGYVK